MDEKEPVLGMTVYKQRGDGVTLAVLDLHGDGTPVFEHGAMTWAEVYHWANVKGVPRNRIVVDPRAEDELGPH